MNKAFVPPRWLSPLLLATPALAAGGVDSGLAIGACGLLIIASALCANELAKKISESAAQQGMVLIAAAATAALCDVLARAFAWPLQTGLQPWLPLMAINSVFVIQQWETRPHVMPRKQQITYVIVTTLIAPSLIGTVREFTGALLFSLSASVLIGAGLLIAANNHWRPDRGAQNPAPDQKKTRRVRVTGPIS